jgi:hypothetical protein
LANESKRDLFNDQKHGDLILDEQDNTNEGNEINDEDGDGFDDNAIVKNTNLKDELLSSFKAKSKNGYNDNFLSNNLIVENDENETNSYDNNKNDNFRMTTIEMKENNNKDYHDMVSNNKNIEYENSDLQPEHQSQIATTTTHPISTTTTTTTDLTTFSIITKSLYNISTTLPLNSKSLTELSTTNIENLISTTIETDQNKNTTSTPNKGR